MATIADKVLDDGLNTLTNDANRVDITSQEATSYTDATSTSTLGNTTSITISSPADRTGGGRKVTLSAISGGSVTGTGTATHYSISDTTNSVLLVTGSLTASQSVTTGNTFSLEALDVGIPDPS
tara:strand:+ start:461 stop:832 length:372 start_codon:yes stop_codon:yes gene_type:complete